MIQIIALFLNVVALVITLSWLFNIPSLDYAAQGAILSFVSLFNLYALHKMRIAHLRDLRAASATMDALTAALQAMMQSLQDISNKYRKLYEEHHGKNNQL